MNVLILGLGSIGQRHLRNLRTIDKKVKFFTLRRKYTTPFLNNKNQVVKGKIEKAYNIKNFKTFKEIKNIDAALICTPSKFHISEAITLLKKNIHLFIEKPLGSSLKDIDKLKKIILSKPKIKTMMGFQLKFNPLILKLKKLIENNAIGRIYSCHVHHGEHISDFHPYEDYKISYAARKSLGGGVVLTQIHEIDYLLFLFKNYKINIMKSFSAKISNLKIDVEDVLEAYLKLENKKKHEIFCNLHLNFFERPKKREIKLLGENGKIECDLNKLEINIFKNKNLKSIKFNIDRNEIFKDELKYFLKCIKNKKKISSDYDVLNGIKSLKIALKLK
tara:strand:+ start:137 stop:1135 length:999 start_codon:yes stop_codon:yes gene_type:complete